jgi:predicted HTH transcriptional regulator
MLTDQQLADAFDLGREQGAVEFKSPGARSNRRMAAVVIKAMIGMSNRRDGGHVVIGVTDNGGSIVPVGVAEDDLRTWTFDALADVVAQYVEPSIDFNIRVATINEMRFVVIEVAEFAEVPTLCKRDYNIDGETILREGACYIRPRRKPETVEVATYADMRDLIDLATEKSVRRFLAAAHRAGLSAESDIDHAAAFDAQAKDIL